MPCDVFQLEQERNSSANDIGRWSLTWMDGQLDSYVSELLEIVILSVTHFG